MGFRFPLSVVLQVRIRAEEREETLLKQISAELAKATQTLEEIEAALVSAHGERVASAGTSMMALNLSARYGEIENLIQRRGALMEHIHNLEQLRQRQMDVYCAARRDRETLDELREEQRTAYQIDADQREQASANDIAVGQHVRKKVSVDSRNMTKNG